jgi:hypothetical protein
MSRVLLERRLFTGTASTAMGKDAMSRAHRPYCLLWQALLVVLFACGCGGRTADLLDEPGAGRPGDAGQTADARGADARFVPDARSTDAGVRPLADAGSDEVRTLDARVVPGPPSMPIADARAVDAPPARTDAGSPGPRDAGRPPQPVVISIAVQPGSADVTVGTSTRLNVIASLSDRTTIDVSARASFSSSDEAVVTLASNLALARALGTATVTATFNGLAAVSVIAVRASDVSIKVIGATSSCTRYESVTLRAIAVNSDGIAEDVTRRATWSSSSLNVSVQSGTALCLAPGTAVISATLDGARGSTTLVVQGRTVKGYAIDNPPLVMRVGELSSFSLRVDYEDGGSEYPTDVAWESGSPAILAADPTSPSRFQALASGVAVVSARLGGAAVAQTTVPVTAGTLQSITITPALLEVTYPSNGKFMAYGTYSDGVRADLTRRVAWAGDGAGRIDVSDGVVTAFAAGTSIVTARSDEGGLSATAQVTVLPGAPTGLSGGDDFTVPRGIPMRLFASAEYANGNSLDVSDVVTWTVGDATVATPVGTSLVGSRAGTTTYVGSLGALKTRTGTATISNAKLLSIEFVPGHLNLAIGEVYDTNVNGTFDDASQQDVTAAATFTTGNESIVGFSNDLPTRGRDTARAAGTTSITAVVNGVAATTTVTVYP